MRKVLICLLVLTMLSVGCSSKEAEKLPSIPVTEVSEAEIETVNPLDEIIDSMSDEELIGQMMVFQLDGVNAPSQKTLDLINKTHCSNFLLLESNCKSVDQVASLLEQTNQNNPKPEIPFWYCIDEEGGDVTRFNLGVPSARETAKSEDPEGNSRKNGEDIAKVLKAAGIQLCLAPVLDTAKNLSKSSMGSRIFDSNPEVVSTLALEFIRGLHHYGIASSVKHFPGVGNTSVDSHEDFPIVNRSREEIESFELVPFKNVINNRVDIVMVGHILLPAYDDVNPASISKSITTDLLRNELGWDGVIMTDDMYMGAIVSHYKIEDACLMAIQAGADMVLTLSDGQAVYEKILAALNDGTLTRDRLEESARRIITMKLKYEMRSDVIRGLNTLWNKELLLP